MIIGGSKKEVVANIKNAADNGRFNDKVEIGDPELDSTRRKKLLGKYVNSVMKFHIITGTGLQEELLIL